nr:immunoglobulin light chain junction region [Macaca mulatta]MOW10924.1 immunoglobulin light chain junction region [Macaca mulatta]MOW13053.1 immunoglobulin light chain junction region [Macaca mulatta]MOW13229.1 immunoglobulin light chain junction region [Macaca mulatta]
CQTYIISPFTF